MNVFAINPGSTSTKFALFESQKCIFEKTVRHDAEKIKSFATVLSQLNFRLDVISKVLHDEGIDLSGVVAFVGRGGLLRPLSGGTYRVNETMLADLQAARYGEHASNLGAVIASMLAEKQGKPAFIVNPVVVDELMDIARITGLPEMKRVCVFHALNQKAVAHRAAAEYHLDYNQARFIVAHLGGGVSVGAHDRGRVIDVNNGLDEGPFSPERSGSLPMSQLIDLCYSGRYTQKELMRKLIGNGGMVAHTGTSDCRLLEERASDDDKVRLLLEAFIYQVSQEICARAAALFGQVDYVLITGGLAFSKMITDGIRERVSFLAPVLVYPGEDEMKALVEGVLEVLSGQEKVLVY